MRLIDADALDDVITRLNFNENWGITRGEYKLINSVLFEFPTVDAVPARHGKWYELATYEGCEVDLRCSNCGATVSGFVQNYKYCPYCGARMDEG